MTLASYVAAQYKKKNFSEPQLLAKIEKKIMPLSESLALPAGWAMHYAIGVMMTLLFELYKTISSGKNPVYRALIFGTFGGVAAVLAWNILFEALPGRSQRFYKQFFTQLFLVHFIFAFTVMASQKALPKKPR